MKRLAAVTLLAVLPLAAPPLVAHAAVATCQGEPATLVGKPGAPLNGTAGRDVMVSRGASHVNAGDGDDVVCITGSTKDGYRVRVAAGNGNDSVLVTGNNTVRAFLGDGRDNFSGADEADDVLGGDFDDDEFNDYRDDDADTITTAGGDDVVTASHHDSIALGSGDDGLQWAGPAGEPYTGEADGGPGRNSLDVAALNVEGEEPASWVLDSRAATLSRDGEVLASWSRFTRFFVGVDAGVERLLMTGSSRDESFDPYSIGLSGPPITVEAGGGNDTIDVGGSDTPGELDLDIDGGPGRDLVHLRGYEFVRASLVLDLAAGTYRYQDDEASEKVPLDGIEDAEVQGIPEVTLRGDSSANRLTVRADQTDFPVFKRCQVVVSGGGGDDRLTLLSAPIQSSWKNCPAPVLRGQAGNDVLVGSLLGERLLGGSGRDVARGGPGTDSCIAETQMGCERR